MSRTTTIRVNEIHCTSCENTIRTALSRLPGVASVDPKQETNEVRIQFNPVQVGDEQLRAKLSEIGYEPVD